MSVSRWKLLAESVLVSLMFPMMTEGWLTMVGTLPLSAAAVPFPADWLSLLDFPLLERQLLQESMTNKNYIH